MSKPRYLTKTISTDDYYLLTSTKFEGDSVVVIRDKMYVVHSDSGTLAGIVYLSDTPATEDGDFVIDIQQVVSEFCN